MQSTDYSSEKWISVKCSFAFQQGNSSAELDPSVKSQNRNLIGKIQLIWTAKECRILRVYPLYQGLIAGVYLCSEIKAEICVPWQNWNRREEYKHSIFIYPLHMHRHAKKTHEYICMHIKTQLNAYRDAFTFANENDRGKETYRLTGRQREREVGQTGVLSCKVKQCRLVIQKIESERCFRERQWIKGDRLSRSIPQWFARAKIKAV